MYNIMLISYAYIHIIYVNKLIVVM